MEIINLLGLEGALITWGRIFSEHGLKTLDLQLLKISERELIGGRRRRGCAPEQGKRKVEEAVTIFSDCVLDGVRFPRPGTTIRSDEV